MATTEAAKPIHLHNVRCDDRFRCRNPECLCEIKNLSRAVRRRPNDGQLALLLWKRDGKSVIGGRTGEIPKRQPMTPLRKLAKRNPSRPEQPHPAPPEPEQPTPQPPQPEIPPSGPEEPHLPSPGPEPLPTPVPGPTDPALPHPILASA
jgi:hypothetical protein